MAESTDSNATESAEAPAPADEAAPDSALLEALDPIVPAGTDPATAGPEAESPPPLPDPVLVTPGPAQPLRAAPVDVEQRYATLDVVRGVALCGILLVNMENFAMVREARYDPALSGGDSPLDHLIWLGTYLFADTKFLAMFTMLFGAGIAAANERRGARQTARSRWWDLRGVAILPVAAAIYFLYFSWEDDFFFRVYIAVWAIGSFLVPREEAIHYRRHLFLLGVGLAHGLFLWRGDILYYYAFWGLALYFAPRIPWPLLGVAGLAAYALFLEHFSAQIMDGPEGYSWWEREIFRGDWAMQHRYRMDTQDFYQRVLPIEFAPHLVGLMLLGMALYKLGLLKGRGPAWIYAGFAALALSAGGYFVIHGTQLSARFDGQAEAREFVWGSLALSLGYMSAAIALTKIFGLRFGLGGLAALGRMAFTNYLLQSAICTTIFYGYGFGLFERTTRTEQFGLAAAILALEMLLSLAWFRVFRFGPLEWVWRCFSYLRFQPILRAAAPGGPAGPML